MQVICEKCHASHRLEHIRVREGFFLCSRCGRKSRFSEELVAKAKPKAPALPRPTPPRLPAAAQQTPRPPPPSPKKAPASSPESSSQKKRWQLLRSDGTRITLQGLGSLQEWIIEGTLRREDQISRLGQKWKRLGEIQELLPFFEEAERRAAQLAVQIQTSGPGATIPFPVVEAKPKAPPPPAAPPPTQRPAAPEQTPEPPPEEEGRTATLRGVTANPPWPPGGGVGAPKVVSTAPVVLSRPASPLRVRQASSGPPFQVQEPPGPRLISTPRFPYEVLSLSPIGKEEPPATEAPKEAAPPQTEPSLPVALLNALQRETEGEEARAEGASSGSTEAPPEPEKAPPPAPPEDEATEREIAPQAHRLPEPSRVDFAPPEVLSVDVGPVRRAHPVAEQAPVSLAPYEDSGEVAPYSPHSALEQSQTYRELEIKDIEQAIKEPPPPLPSAQPRYVSHAPALQVDATLAREMEVWRQAASPEGQLAPTRPLRLHTSKNLLPLWIALSALLLGSAALLIALWPSAPPKTRPTLVELAPSPESERHKGFVKEGDASLQKDSDEELELASTSYKQALGLQDAYPPALSGLVLVHTRRAAHLQDDAARDAQVLAALEGDLDENLEEATRLRVRIDLLQEEAQKELRWAQKYADQAQKAAPQARAVLAAVAEYQLLARDREGFLDTLSQLQKNFPQTWESDYLEGLFAFQKVGQGSTAEALLKKALAQAPGLVRARYRLARYLEEQKRFPEAREQTALILEQSPRHTRAALLQKRLSNEGEASAALPTTLPGEPPLPEDPSEEDVEKDADEWAKEGDRMARKGKFGAALSAYLAALDQDPRHLPALLGAGSAYLRQGRPDYACSKYRLALGVSPRNAEALFGAAECHHEMKNTDEAIRRYKEYLSRSPQGAYAETARKRLSDLGVATAPPKPLPASAPASAPAP